MNRPRSRRSFTSATYADWEAHRTKPRVFLVLDPEERDSAKEMAREDGLSLSVFVGQMIRAEVGRRRKR